MNLKRREGKGTGMPKPGYWQEQRKLARMAKRAIAISRAAFDKPLDSAASVAEHLDMFGFEPQRKTLQTRGHSVCAGHVKRSDGALTYGRFRGRNVKSFAYRVK